ncbi:hypothetical protein [Mumia zhuanghuii]|nr:hypothetical protein [Mumia zhuanghuii]
MLLVLSGDKFLFQRLETRLTFQEMVLRLRLGRFVVVVQLSY